MNPTVSLMVPVFNRVNLLGACLDSALDQTVPDLEVIVVDGASTDGTWELCQRYASSDSRIRTFREETNRGPVPGWWRCIEEARGQLATFLWSDDLLRPTFLERTLPFLADDGVAFAFTAAEIGPTPGTGRLTYSNLRDPFPARAFIEGTLLGRADLPVSPACALFRLEDLKRSFVAELPTDPPVDLRSTGAGTDVLMYLLTGLRYPRVASVPEPLAFFRSHPGSITIHGRDGEVAFNYALAKAWFARTNGFAHRAPRILAKHWLRQMRLGRKVISPRQAARSYRHLVTAGELVRATIRETLWLAARAGAMAIRRR